MGTQVQPRQKAHPPSNKGVIAVLNRVADQAARSNKLLAAILEQLQRETAVLEPNYRRDLAEYGAFDWSSIGAIVIEKDDYGAAKVEWSGHHWLRRNSSPDNKYGAAVWFSRPVSGAGDSTVYYTLIKFAPYKAENMSSGTAPKLNSSTDGCQAKRPLPTEKDWKAEASATTDELMFDTAYQQYRSDYFTESTKVQSARVHICGEWLDSPHHATRCVAALDIYVDFILAEEDKQRQQTGYKIDGQVGIARAKVAFKEWENAKK